jgi:ADA HAT complex component 1
MANASHPIIQILPPSLSKRKRESSQGASDDLDRSIEMHDAKRRKPDALMSEIPTPVTPVPETQTCEKNAATAAVTVPSSRIQETIETQLGLEILLKHKELRLINQELAKCQVALEQLRRCHLIPYPTSQETPEAMLNVMNGTGAAVSHKGTVPQWAPAYGVTDGPYSRHYSRWLIPDPSFDGEQVEWHRISDGSRAGKTIPEGRATRHSFVEGSTPGSKSRSQRGSAGQKLQALSSGYPQAKEKAGPCVLKRADGQMVKLVCIDCKRENFSSTQGFINHCRIAHRRDFKSHEEAAVASGQAIEVDEVGGIVGEEKSPTVATGLVHPLIRTAPADKTAYASLITRIEASMELYRQGKLPGVTTIPTSVPSTPTAAGLSTSASSNANFVPSAETPHLSNLMRKKGFNGNLTEFVGDAKKPVDYEEFSSHDEESDSEQLPQRNSDSSAPVMRKPFGATMSATPFKRPISSKGAESQHARMPSGISPRLPHALPAINSTPIMPPVRPHTHLANIQTPSHIDTPRRQHDDMDIEMMHGPSIHDLSPNTVASNNAPSLVSDDGEYEDGDDVESVASEEDEGSDVAEIDIEDGVAVQRTVIRKRAGSGGDVRLKKGEDKHVTFVSPGKDRRKK